MFRLDDVDLDFGDLDEAEPVANPSKPQFALGGATTAIADENDGRLSFGYETSPRHNNSSADIFCEVESPPVKRRAEVFNIPSDRRLFDAPEVQMREGTSTVRTATKKFSFNRPLPEAPIFETSPQVDYSTTPTVAKKFSFHPPPPDTPVFETTPRKSFSTTPTAKQLSTDRSPSGTPKLETTTRRHQVTPPSAIERRERQKEGGRKSAKKLPGPAGSLPKLKPNQNLNELVLPRTDRRSVPEKSSQPLSQHSSQGDDEPWSAARLTIGPVLWPLFEKYCISKVTAQAKRRQLSARSKVPCMCVQIDDISVESVDARVRLKDHSGLMNGTLHREALRSFRDLLRTGSVILLKLVSVFSPTPKNHYLNITRTNLLHVFGDGSGACSGPPPLSLELVRQWEMQCSSPPAAPPVRPLRPPARAPQRMPPAPQRAPPAQRRPQPPPPAESSAQELLDLMDDGMDDLLVSSMCEEMLSEW